MGERIAMQTRFLYAEMARLELCLEFSEGEVVSVEFGFVTRLFEAGILFALQAYQSGPELPDAIRLTSSVTVGWRDMARLSSIADLQNGIDPCFLDYVATGAGSKVAPSFKPDSTLWDEVQRLMRARPKVGQPGLFHVSRKDTRLHE
ncbi:hypothetical protein [Methylorubrum salsuginis]|uniref:hypothetical protein n=1 Tax=Methylorubrum salsuginis TaxID=414703 RepID=UPI0013F4D130|nr:hypothetical protein [Methylorubrum salsuginis]